jgi:hypothetical protein
VIPNGHTSEPGYESIRLTCADTERYGDSACPSRVATSAITSRKRDCNVTALGFCASEPENRITGSSLATVSLTNGCRLLTERLEMECIAATLENDLDTFDRPCEEPHKVPQVELANTGQRHNATGRDESY